MEEQKIHKNKEHKNQNNQINSNSIISQSLLPVGLIHYSHYQQKIKNLLNLNQRNIISNKFYTNILPKNMKIIMKISKCKSGLFVENVYKAYLKYNDRLIMTIKKKVLNGFQFYKSVQKSQISMIFRLKNRINSNIYKLLQKNKNFDQNIKQLAILNLQDYSEIISFKQDLNYQQKENIIPKKVCNHYNNTLKLDKSVFKSQDFLRKYYYIHHKHSHIYTFRKIDHFNWQFSFQFPLAPIYALALTFALIDHQ